MALRKSLESYTFFQIRNRYIYTLPNEMIISVLSHLKIADLLNSMLVCIKLYRAANQHSLWRDLFKQYFLVNPAGKNIKKMFILHYQCEETFYQNPYTVDPNLLATKLTSIRVYLPKHSNLVWVDYLLAKFMVYNIADLSTSSMNKRELFNFLIDSARELGNPNAFLLAYYASTLPENEKHALLLEAHHKGCTDATLLLAMNLTSQKNISNVASALNTHIDRLELLITAANRGNPRAAYFLAKEYERSIDKFIAYYVKTTPNFSATEIIPCSEKEWATYKEMQTNAQRSMSDKHYKLGHNYKTTLFFNEKTRLNALAERKERALYWYQKAADKNTPNAENDLTQFKSRDLKAELASRPHYGTSSKQH